MVCMDIFSRKTKRRFFAIFLAINFILSTKGVMQNVEGRVVVHGRSGIFGSEKIGSAPPRCDGKCRWCGHCEAIQVPAIAQTTTRNGLDSISSTALAYTNTFKNADSNYKPLSWKCKCGKFIFNP